MFQAMFNKAFEIGMPWSNQQKAFFGEIFSQFSCPYWIELLLSLRIRETELVNDDPVCLELLWVLSKECYRFLNHKAVAKIIVQFCLLIVWSVCELML